MIFVIRYAIIFLLFFTSFAYALSVSGYESVHDESLSENVTSLSSDLCDPNPCQNGGQCLVRSSGYKCICKISFFGRNCEMDSCTESPCQNGGTCVLTRYSYKCECRYPYRGDVCQEDLCVNDPCYNGGTCEMVGNWYKCKCRFPYSGENCEEKLIGTTSDDKEVSTSDITNDYQWTTNESSEFSEIFNETTDSYQWTSNDSSEFSEIFNDTTDSYQWTSNEPSEFTDDFNATYNPSNFTEDFNVSLYEIKNFTESYNLTTIKPGICAEDRDCYNGAVCRRREGEYYCDCLPNFEGDRCEINMLCEKLDSTCRAMGATCKVIGFNAICDCTYEKMYNPRSGICENICDPWRCMHGTCEIIERTFKCNCDSGYMGRNCNERIKINPDRRNLWFPVMTFLMTLICLLLIGVICLNCHNRK